MSDDEVMRFEITDNDLDNEFNFGLRRPRISKNRATYGIWAEDSDDDDPDARPSFGGGGPPASKKSGRMDYSAPIGFVSGGLKKTAKEEDEDMKSKKAIKGEESDNEDTFSATLAPKPKKKAKKSKGPEFVGGEIAGLRKTGYSQPVSLGKGFGDWEKYTKGIGAKLLLKMGFEGGKGLGKELQGRSTIIEAHLRKGRGAIGAYGKEGNRPKLQKDSEEEEEEEFKEKLHQWKKGGSGAGASGQKKVKYVYKTADQILEDGKWRQISGSAGNADSNKVKIIDMTGKEQRILSSYHAIGAQKIRPEDEETQVKDGMSMKKVVFDLPELRHNVDLLLDQCEEELIAHDRALKHHKNRMEVLKTEEEKLVILTERESGEIKTLNEILEAIEKLEALHEKGDLDLESAREMLEKLSKKYPKEYRGLEMPYIAMTIVVPLLKQQLKSWDCLENPHVHLDEFLQWKQILSLSHAYNEHKQTDPMDPYHSLLWESWMPTVRQAITSWNPKDPEQLIRFLEVWKHMIPKWMQRNIYEHILLPKLQSAVELWDPRSDLIPIDSWVIPWLPMLDDQLEIVYPTIRNKLASALTAWHPSDTSARVVLSPWKDIFPKEMATFVIKNILPKLEQTMKAELVINPAQQNLDAWHWVMSWTDFFPIPVFTNLLERTFWTPWLTKLSSWLNQNPNYNEVTNWYKGWKSIIPPELVNTPQVQQELQKALNFMTNTVNMSSGHPMSRQPGATEAMMYLSSTERQFNPGSDMRMGASSAATSVSEAVKMASQISSAPGNYRDLIARRCEERGILFRPVPSKYYEGKQVYQCGSLFIYIDRNAIFKQNKDMWIPTSLNTLLDSV